VEYLGKNGWNYHHIDFLQRVLCRQSNTGQLSRNQHLCDVLSWNVSVELKKSKQERIMRCASPLLGRILSCGIILSCLATAGCTHSYYDPYYHDYHHWNRGEVVYYNQWTVQNHIDPHRKFKDLNQDQQKQYWDWRHSQDHDHK
jgi:hypothetical protein